MNLIALASLSFGMSMDAFAVAVAKGAGYKHPSLIKALKGGLFFGVIEAIAPLIGYGLGKVASGWLSSFDHWVAFVLLTFLGLKFIQESFSDDDNETDEHAEQGLWLMTLTAIATSVDSVVVGVSLAFVTVNIYLACLLIGLATTIMTTLGLYLGNRLGAKFGKKAMGIGGVVLIGIGGLIMSSHLS